MIKIVGQNGQSVNTELQKTVAQIKERLLKAAKYSIRDGLFYTTRNHFSRIYPGSWHYSPEKVEKGSASIGNNYAEGSIQINVPGITRAYHNMSIYPKAKKYLTIPLHRDSYGKKATEFSDTFVLTNKNKNKFIVQKQQSGLVFLYYLSKYVFQPQDPGLMPADQTFANNIFARIKFAL